jgi:hypothetical protein
MELQFNVNEESKEILFLNNKPTNVNSTLVALCITFCV